MVDTVTSILQEYSAYTDAQMRAVLNKRKSVGRLYDMMKYHLGWLGEDFRECHAPRARACGRPCGLLACEAVSGDRR